MAPVYMKLFILVVFLVGVGFCQNNTTTIAAVTPTAATTATTATGTSVSSSSSSATVATSSPTTATQSVSYGLQIFMAVIVGIGVTNQQVLILVFLSIGSSDINDNDI